MIDVSQCFVEIYSTFYKNSFAQSRNIPHVHNINLIVMVLFTPLEWKLDTNRRSLADVSFPGYFSLFGAFQKSENPKTFSRLF
jgi:hypothetical protein